MIKSKIACFIICSLWLVQASAAELQYAIIVDAGSSSSKLHIFQNDNEKLPNITDVFSEKATPPLASFASHPQDAGASLKPVLDDALKYFANHNISADNIKIRVLGTAGMRLLDKNSQREIYKNVKTYIVTNYAPQLLVMDTRTLTGKEEGLFDWLDVNYLSNNFNNHSETVGSLDVGGASTQIAFATTDFSKIKNETHINVNGQDYIVFSKSFLGLGQDQARSSMNTYPLASACYPVGYLLNNSVPGDFNFPSCTSNYSQLIDSYHVSEEILPINPDQKFIAFSGAYYAFNFFGVDQTPYQQLVESQINTVCAETWDQMKINYPSTSENYLSTECANGTYIDDLFFNYYHLKDGQLKVLITINSKGIDWTLGAMLYNLIS
jgi:hypothetical protein